MVGTPIANRTHSEMEGLIGFFVNTLALRATCPGDPSFVELLGRVREAALGAYAHQDLPFEKLVEELQPERNLSHSPLFQVMFVLQNAPGGTMNLRGLQIEGMRREWTSAKFDLQSCLSITQGDAAVWSTTRIFSMPRPSSGCSVTSRPCWKASSPIPSSSLSRLPLLTPARARAVGRLECTPDATTTSTGAVHQLIEEQAARTPERTALVFDGQTLTYRRTQRTRQSPRPPPAEARRQHPKPSSACMPTLPRDGRGHSSPSSKPEEPTFPSIPTIPRSASKACSRMPTCLWCSRQEALLAALPPPTALCLSLEAAESQALPLPDSDPRERSEGASIWLT